jgi:thioredoxin-dependent peroxiredoxin
MANVTLKSNSIHTVGELPKVGNPGPDFRLTRGELSDISLPTSRAKWRPSTSCPASTPASGRPRRALEQVAAGREYRGPP